MGARALPLVAAFTLLVVAPAAARTIPVAGTPLGGPALGATGVAWVGHDGLWEAEHGQRATRVQLFDEGEDRRLSLSRLEASPSGLVLAKGLLQVMHTSDGDILASDGFEVLTGAWGQPLTAVRGRCSTDDLLESIDVDGNIAAYASCGGGGGVVSDYSSDPPRSETLPGAGFGLRVAGRYAAWLERPDPPGSDLYGLRYDVVVYDRAAKQVSYRIPASAMRGGLHSLDLQDDGKLVIAVADLVRADHDTRTRVTWASPAEPRLHDLPLRPAGSYTVRIADNTIGFERGASGDNVVAPAEVGVASLHGQEHVVARNGEANVLYPSFDYDGHRLAWWSYGCRRPQVEYLEASSRSGPGLNRTGCRLLFKRAPQLDGRFKLRFAVDCYGFFGCSVPKLVMAESHDRKAVIARGRGRHARLTKLGRRALDRAGRVRVRVQAIITDGAGRRERRSTSVVLQSARRG